MERFYYDQETVWFYSSVDHGDRIPRSAIELEEDEYRSLIAGMQEAKSVVVMQAGRPVLVDRAETPRAVVLEREARRLLASSDLVVLRSYESGEPVPSAWVAYREQLRALVRGEPDAVKAGLPLPPGF